jgi:hypothetical protein
MLPETNKQLGKRWFEKAWNQIRRGAFEELLAPNTLLHQDTTGHGPGFYPFFDRMQAALSSRITVHHPLADG